MAHPELVTIFGGAGFVGTQVVQLLARAGCRMRVAVRRPDLAGHVRPLGNVGQVVRSRPMCAIATRSRRRCRGAGIVINLVGVGLESGPPAFSRGQCRWGHARSRKPAAAAGASRLIHMSVLGAADNSPSNFARSRATGEADVLKRRSRPP